MIHAAVLILKIIGWILLGILGIILGILLFVLFSAVRYRIDGEKKERLEGSARVTWLFWILSVTAVYRDGLSIKVRIFGRTIWKTQTTEPVSDLAEREPADSVSESAEPQPHLTAEMKQEEYLQELSNLHQTENRIKDSWKDRNRQDSRQEVTGLVSESKNAVSDRDAEVSETIRDEAKSGFVSAHKERSKKPSFWDKMKGWIFTVKERVLSMIKKLQFSIQSICGKLKQAEDQILWIRAKWEAAQAFIQDPANQKSAKLILRQIKKIFEHLLPRKGKLILTFGLEDPYQMGQILSIASFLYPFVHNHLELSPVFGQKVLEGEVHIRGRIRLGVLLGYGLRLLLDGNIRKRIWYWIRPSKKQSRNTKIAA